MQKLLVFSCLVVFTALVGRPPVLAAGRPAEVVPSDEVLRWVLGNPSTATVVIVRVRRVIPVRCPGCVDYELEDVRSLAGPAWKSGRRLFRNEPLLGQGRTYVLAWGQGCRPGLLAVQPLRAEHVDRAEAILRSRLARLRSDRSAAPPSAGVCRNTPLERAERPVLD